MPKKHVKCRNQKSDVIETSRQSQQTFSEPKPETRIRALKSMDLRDADVHKLRNYDFNIMAFNHPEGTKLNLRWTVNPDSINAKLITWSGTRR
jgi:hypothetical protein